ncbi:hypothetical protein DRO26_01330 [Candidatus Bathyarchaeota archaeon]|nr:MAG: hypothetical protein DRO26_01330 [Candidatus Bathyarchaeota archaeon]
MKNFVEFFVHFHSKPFLETGTSKDKYFIYRSEEELILDGKPFLFIPLISAMVHQCSDRPSLIIEVL